jgi:hypothetical protein
MMTDETLPTVWQFSAFIGLALAVTGLVAILLPEATGFFRRFLGDYNPILVVLLTSMAGGLALAFLRRCCGFEILVGRKTLEGVIIAGGLATLMGVIIVIADLLMRYPETINVPWPEAWIFYPTIGFIAEVLFHVVPLALLLLLLKPLVGRVPSERVIWGAILCVAIVEPTFQVLLDRGPLDRLDVYTGAHVFVIALLQLAIFWRYDFFSMYAFRLWYYACWHILWGALRLRWLF